VISFRYHVVSLVAVFFALALGIALGAGPLQESVTSSVADTSETSDSSDAEQAEELASAADRIAYDDAFVAAAAPQLLDSRLDATVSIVSLPGADPTDVRQLQEHVSDAGGSVVSSLAVTTTMLDPAKRGLAQSLAETTLRNAESTAPDGATSYELLGAAFARAFLTGDAAGSEQDAQAAAIEAALLESDFVTIDGQVDERADVALVVEGEPVPDAVAGSADVAAELVAAFDRGARGVVLAGPDTAAPGGALAEVRDSTAADSVSTVDVVDAAAGRVAAVLALAEQVSGEAGHYGSDDAPDGPLPVAVLSADR
jgi:hypothetical protein